MHAILEKTYTLFIWTTFNRKKMVLAEINKEWPSDKGIPSFRPHNREEVLKLDEFVRRLTEGEGSSKFMFQKCGFGPNAIREMVMSHMRERRRKEKDSHVVVCKLPSHLQLTVVGIQRVSSQALMTPPQVLKVLWKKIDRNIQTIFTPVSKSKCK